MLLLERSQITSAKRESHILFYIICDLNAADFICKSIKHARFLIIFQLILFYKLGFLKYANLPKTLI
jgi:hypothetical protein